MRLGGLRPRLRSSRDLGLERANRPACVDCATGQGAPAAVVRLGQQRLAVALGQCGGVDHLDRFVGEVEQAQGVRQIAGASAYASRQFGRRHA
jgi:hypothetical protein